MLDENLKSFYLIGGTALALYVGHRKSIDLDLFSQQSFNTNDLEKYMINAYDFKVRNPQQKSSATLIGYINGIKVDFICYDYPHIKPTCVHDEIRLLSIYDIAAMKLIAISQSGTRLKDFVDIAFLSVKMPLKTMLDSFEAKYPHTNKMSAVKGLTFFDDIDFSVDIELTTKGIYKWEKIEKRLFEMVKNPNKIFITNPE
jgi:hypothetical protein